MDMVIQESTLAHCLNSKCSIFHSLNINCTLVQCWSSCTVKFSQYQENNTCKGISQSHNLRSTDTGMDITSALTCRHREWFKKIEAIEHNYYVSVFDTDTRRAPNTTSIWSVSATQVITFTIYIIEIMQKISQTIGTSQFPTL